MRYNSPAENGTASVATAGPCPYAGIVPVLIFTSASLGRMPYFDSVRSGFRPRRISNRVALRREVEVVSADCRNGEGEELAAGRGGDTGCFKVLQQIDRALVEPEVVDRVNDFPVLDQPDAVAGEAGDHGVLRVDRANVPEPGDEQGARSVGDQGFERLVRAFQDQAAGERDRLGV